MVLQNIIMESDLQGKESVEDVVSKLGKDLRHERVDKYEIERQLNKINSLDEQIIARGHDVPPRDRGTLIPLMQTIQDDLYRLKGATWRSVYLANKRHKRDEETIRLKRELYYVERESETLINHLKEADKVINQLSPKHEAAAIGAAIILIAMSGLLFSSYKSYTIFVKPFTGLSILPSISLAMYFVFATILVLMMFGFLFSVRRK